MKVRFQGKRLLGYFESHDEERVMYKALQFGNDWDGYNIQNLIPHFQECLQLEQ